MACSSPLYGVRRKVVFEDGIIGYGYLVSGSGELKVHYDNRFQFLSLRKYNPDNKSNYFATPQERLKYFNKCKDDPNMDAVLIPCGRCLECRLEYSRQWANRQMLEAATSYNNWFLTLTYSPEHLPKNSQGYPTLIKEHVPEFIKRVRAYFKYHCHVDNIRFFACGEYGDEHGRPHYHVNFFNLPLFDLEFAFNKNGKPYFTSKILNELWSDAVPDPNGKRIRGKKGKYKLIPRGIVVVGELNWDTAAYVARYVVKKAKGATSSVYKDLDIQPEFCQMSTHPGIAREYYDANKDTIYKYDKITVPGGKRVRPSHYYDKLYDVDDPCFLADLKAKRIAVAEASQEIQLSNTDLDPLEYQKVCHEALMKKIKSLKRDVI